MTMRFVPKTENTAATVIDGEAIIVNLTTGVYYSMDGIGAEVWMMLEDGLTSDQIASAIAARYEVTATVAGLDLDALIARLQSEDLVTADDTVEKPSPEIQPVEHRLVYVAPTLSIYRDMGDLLALDPPMPGLRDIPLQTQTPPGA